MSTEDKIQELQDLTADPEWDCVDHSPPIPGSSWDFIRSMLNILEMSIMHMPIPDRISPCGDGSIHVTYHIHDTLTLFVEVWPDDPDPEDDDVYCCCLRDRSMMVGDARQYTSYETEVEFIEFIRGLFR